MLEQAIKAIAGLAEAAVKKVPVMITLPGERYAIVDKDGAMGPVQDNPPPPHKQTFSDPNQLATFLKDHHQDAVVFIGGQEIVAVYDLDTRRDRASCKFVNHEQYKRLDEVSGAPMSQQQLVRFLRIDMKGCLPSDSLLNIIRKINFRVGQDGSAQIDHGSHSLSKNVMAQVAGIEAIPEEVLLMVPVLEYAPAMKQPIRCAVEIFPDSQTLAITPYPGEMDQAMTAALELLRSGIADVVGHANIYLGQP